MILGGTCLPILVWQLPRWSKGLDPTFLHPNFFVNSEIPIYMYLAKLYPMGWLIILIGVIIRIFHNYGWPIRRL